MFISKGSEAGHERFRDLCYFLEKSTLIGKVCNQAKLSLIDLYLKLLVLTSIQNFQVKFFENLGTVNFLPDYFRNFRISLCDPIKLFSRIRTEIMLP